MTRLMTFWFAAVSLVYALAGHWLTAFLFAGFMLMAAGAYYLERAMRRGK